MNPTPVSIKVMPLFPLEKRGTDESFYYVADVVENLTKSIKKMIVPSSFGNDLQRDKFYCLRNVTVGDIIKMNTRSMIFQCAPFEYDKEEVERFLVPAEISVREAFAAPDNKRITVTGILMKVSDILKTEHSIRRILYVDDIGGGMNIQVKLWGEQIKMEIPDAESEVKITNVIVQTYSGLKSLNGTTTTEIMENSAVTEYEGMVDGISLQENNALVMMDDKMLKVDKDLLETIFPQCIFSANVTVKGKRKGLTIITIHKAAEPSKKKKKA